MGKRDRAYSQPLGLDCRVSGISRRTDQSTCSEEVTPAAAIRSTCARCRG